LTFGKSSSPDRVKNAKLGDRVAMGLILSKWLAWHFTKTFIDI
jgi:hypothetical protein